MGIAVEDVQDMRDEIERLKHEFADLKRHYHMAMTHEQALENELAITRRALELACEYGGDFFPDELIQQAREEADDND